MRIGDVTGEEALKAETALNSVGVSIRELDGKTMRPFMDIVEELSGKWGTLDGVTQSYVSDALGGARQLNTVLAGMSNMARTNELTAIALNSSGEAMKANEIYAESLEGRLTSLDNASQIFWQNFFNSDSLKGAITGLTNIISTLDSVQNKFGSLPLTVGLLTTAFLAFTNNPLKAFSTGFVKSGEHVTNFQKTLTTTMTQMKSTQGIANKASVGINGLGKAFNSAGVQAVVTNAKIIALQATLSLGIGLAIGLVISGLSKLVDSMVVTKEELNEMKDSFSTSFDETDNLDALVQKQKDLQEQLKDTTLTADQQKTKKEELIGVQKELAELLPYTATGFDEEGNKISEDTEAIQENIDKKKELLAMDAVDLAKETGNGQWNHLINNYDKQIAKVKELQEIYNDAPTPINLENLTEGEKKLESYKEQVAQLSKMMKAWQDVGFSDSDISEMLLGDIFDNSKYEQEKQLELYTKLKDKVKEYTSTIEENTKAKENNANTSSDGNNIESPEVDTSGVEALENTYKLLGYTVEDTAKKIEELNGLTQEEQNAEVVKDTTKAYADSISEIEKLQKLIKSINDDGQMTASTISSIASAYPEIGSAILDSSSAIDFLNGKIDEQKGIYSACMESMMADDNNWYSNNVANNEAFQSKINELYNRFTKEGADAYNTDLKNYANLTELKNAMNQDLINGLASFLTSLVGGSAETYSRDLKNCKSWGEQKLYIIKQLDSAIAKAERNLAKHIQNVVSISNATGGVNGESAIDEKLSARAQAELNKLNSAREEIETTLGGINTAFDKGLSGITNVGGSNSGKGSSSSSSSKEIADIEIKTQRYYDLENAIEKVNNALDINNILSKNATDDKKLDYIKEEIKLYNQKREALEKLQAEQKKELAELQKSLADNKFTFDSDGNVSNLNNRLKQLESWANSGDKENRQATVKNIQELLDAYESLRDTVASTNSDILDINNSIIDAQKDISSVIKDQYEEWKSYEEKKTSKLKEEIQKRKDLMNKEWETEDYEDKLDSEEAKLNELQSTRQDILRTGDKELIAQIDKQIEEQRKVLNDLIKQQERDNANDKFDDVIEELEKELQEKIDKAESTMTDEELLKKVQGGATSLSDVLNGVVDINDTLSTSVATVGFGIDMWNEKLDTFVNTLNSINPNMALSINGELSGITGSLSASNPISISTVINIDGGTVISEDSFYDAIESNNKYIFKEINNIFKR